MHRTLQGVSVIRISPVPTQLQLKFPSVSLEPRVQGVRGHWLCTHMLAFWVPGPFCKNVGGKASYPESLLGMWILGLPPRLLDHHLYFQPHGCCVYSRFAKHCVLWLSPAAMTPGTTSSGHLPSESLVQIFGPSILPQVTMLLCELVWCCPLGQFAFVVAHSEALRQFGHASLWVHFPGLMIRMWCFSGLAKASLSFSPMT